jgi:hypothetical protein
VREELGLVRGDVDGDRAVALAALAREAEVERLLHVRVAPALLPDRLPVQHLEQQAGAPARRVHLLARDHVTRAHRPALGAAALADAEAALRRRREAPAVARETEVRLDPPRAVGGPEPQVRVERVGLDQLVRVQLEVRVPDRLELAECLHELRPEHLRQQLGVRLPVAVLARERAAVGEDEVGRVLHEGAEPAHALGRLEVEGDARVDAALSVVAEEDAVVAVPVEELPEVAQVRAEPLGRDGRVLPAGPGLELRRDAADADRRLADEPDLLLLGRVGEELHRRRSVPRLLRQVVD